jgi:hypothetical protein
MEWKAQICKTFARLVHKCCHLEIRKDIESLGTQIGLAQRFQTSAVEATQIHMANPRTLMLQEGTHVGHA